MARDEDALLKALGHPLRRALLRRYVESEAVDGLGPKELALSDRRDLGIHSGMVGDGLVKLAEKGALEIVSEAPVRGSVAHFYEATALVKGTPWVLATLGLEG